MKRGLLLVALLLSLGVNLGLVASRWIDTPRSAGPVPASVEVDVAPSTDESEDAPAVDSPVGAAEPTAGPATDRLAPPIERRLRRLAGRMATRLRLEGDERRRFVDLQLDFFRRSARARREGKSLERRLRGELMSSSPDRARAEDLLAQVGARQIELERAFVDTYFDTLAILEPAQQAEYRRILGHLRSLRRAMERRLEEGTDLPERRQVR